jgi:hypothetical protein
VPTRQYDVITVDLVLEIEPLDLDDGAEIHDHADVRIAAQAVDRPDEPSPSRERIVESLRQVHRRATGWHSRTFGEVVGIATA